MKNIGPLPLYLLVAVLCSHQAISQSMFQKVIGGTAGNEIASHAQMTSDSGQIIVGYTESFGAGDADIYLVKMDAAGNLEWSKTYGGADNEIGYDVWPTSDNGYIVVGEILHGVGQGDKDIILVKTDSVGDTLWTKTYGGPDTDIGYSVKQTFDGGYVLVGYTLSYGTGGADSYVIKTNSFGDTTWTRTYSTGFHDFSYSIIQTADSGYIFTGETHYLTDDNAFLIKLDAMGDTMWTKTYEGGGREAGWRVIETLDGGYALVGWTNSFGAGEYDVLLIKTDSMGDTLWVRSYGGLDQDIGLSLAETPDTNYLISGFTFSFGLADGDAYGIAVDATGTLLWSMVYGGRQGDALCSLEPKADGGYVMGGYTYSLGGNGGGEADYYLLHTDSTGSSGTCYESSVPTVTSSSPMIISPVTLYSTRASIVGFVGTTVTTPAATARDGYSISITSSTNNICNGDSSGTATALAIGGTLSYTYAWNDPLSQTTATADSLPSGTYMVVVTDSLGCMDSASVTVTEPAVFAAAITDSSDINCKGDSSGYAAVTPTGGTSPYTYLWDDVNAQTDSLADGLAPGNYNVTVTDTNNCQGQLVLGVSIVEPATVLDLSTSTTQATCGLLNGTANVSATGATPPYFFSWDTSPVQTDSTATGLPFGAYTVTVTDSLGCTDSATVIISNTGGLSVAITDSINILCNGDSTGSATATPTGGTLPYTYLWDDPNAQTDSIASGLSMGTYTVSITDGNGCGAATLVTITESAAINLSITVGPIDCTGNSTGTATVVTAGGISPYSYLWNTSSDSISITGLAAGTYSVTVTDSASCMDSSGVTISDPPVLAVSISGSSDANCTGDSSGTATATATGGTLNYTYSWNDPLAQTTATADSLSSGTYMVVVTDGGGCMDSVSATIADPAVLAASITDSSDVNCNGDSTGYAAVTPGGGMAPYTYLWDDVNAQTDSLADGLPAGNYSVNVTDMNNCQAIVSTSIAESPALALTTSTTSATCGLSNGTANVSASGATAPYSYSWNTSPVQTGSTATGLAPGSHIITVIDSLGCAGSDTVDVSNISGPTLSVTDSVSILCNGDSTGSATASAGGGTQPYTYLWEDGQQTPVATGLAAGSYTVTVSDVNGCSASDSITLGEPTALSSSISITDESCAGNSDGILDLTVSGGTPPYAYTWSNADTSEDISNLTAGFYSVLITDGNGCAKQDTASIDATFAGPQTDTIIGLTLVNLPGQEPYSVTQSPGSSYSWTVNGGSIIAGQGSSTVQILWLSPGTGQVTVVETDSVGCVGDTVILVVQLVTSAEITAYNSIEILVYPNPFDRTATIVFNNETADMYELLLYDMLGNRVRIIENITADEVLLDKGNLAPGMYLIELQGTTRTFRGRIMVE